MDRPDLVIPGCWLTFRSVNTNNGVPSLVLTPQTAAEIGAEMTDENALVRTIELAGSARSVGMVSQECITEIIPVRLAGEGETEAITPAAGADFTAVVKFLARSEGWMASPQTQIKKLTPSAAHSANSTVRRGLEPNGDGEMVEVFYDTSLTRELIAGNITPWMKSGGLNRKSQEQEVGYDVEAIREIDGVLVPWSGTVTRAFRATNASTRTGANAYSFQESSDFTAGEPVPLNLATSLFNSMKDVQYEGEFTLAQRECTFGLRIGQVLNLTGGRAEWATMKAVIQAVTPDTRTGRTSVQFGFNRALGAEDLVAIWRSNRSRQPAERGLIRTTGVF